MKNRKHLEERIHRDWAMVVLDARIYTIVGSAKQKEHYELKKIGGKWLINDIAVKEGVFGLSGSAFEHEMLSHLLYILKIMLFLTS